MIYIAVQNKNAVPQVDVPGISKSQVYDNFRKTMKAPRPTGRYIRTQLDAQAAARFEEAEWSSRENKTIIASSVTPHSL